MTDSLTDEEIARLYREYGWLLLRRLRLLLRDAALAEDALHDGFLRVMGSGAALRSVEAPLRWLYRVFDNVAIDRLRTRRARGPHEPLPDPDFDTVSAAPGVDLAERDAASRLLADLDETDQRIAILTFVDGLTQAEAAAELGLSRVTINKRIQAMRERLLVRVREESASHA